MITKEFMYTGNVNDPKCTKINVCIFISFFNIPTHDATMCIITEPSQLNVKQITWHSSMKMLIPDKNSITNAIFDKCIIPQVQITRSNWMRRQSAAHAACRDPKCISVQRVVCPTIVAVGMAFCVHEPQGIGLFD